ncbi:hypothetical protein H6P81_012505 [Aristolochia fimbriata]|uniref:CID domain-containing protein n=1 Tax=Aristolochia fimbriata TaxID=158543 RepID=A0AAV7EC15_ARIFI|nr:hypothetical protein H6P81_012505 [Aristolochia fimbriata]
MHGNVVAVRVLFILCEACNDRLPGRLHALSGLSLFLHWHLGININIKMNGTFNGQILVDKLAKLNNSQQSIETLSHWCIFHRKKAKQVVETWERQFHCSPREQRVSFLYLANDILQNSRRKGSEFVGEFWKVLPDTLSDVIENGDDFGRTAVFRLVDIWEERKVFGSRGQVLKEELLGRNVEYKPSNGKNSSIVQKSSTGGALEKIVSSYEAVYDGPVEEDAVMAKCKSAISCVEKVEKEVGDYNSGNLTALVDELQGQHQVLRECIEQLRVVESSRAALVSHLKGALQDQEYKLEQLHDELQVAQSRFEQAGNICQQIMNSNNGQLLSDHRQEGAPTYPDMPPNFALETTTTDIVGEKKEQSTPPVVYTQKLSAAENPLSEEEHRKSTAAAVAAKLAASTSSAQMLSYVLSSLASEGVIGKTLNESSSVDFQPEKKPKLENGPSASYVPPQKNPPQPSYPHPESLQHLMPPISSPHQLQSLSTSSTISLAPPTMQQPHIPLLPPLQPPPPPPAGQFLQAAGSMTNVPFSYGAVSQHLPSGYQMAGAPLSSVQPYPSQIQFANIQAADSVYFSQQPLSTTPPISRP